METGFLNDWNRIVHPEYFPKIPDNSLPDIKCRYDAFKCCNPSDLKIIMIGQDPYSTPGIANGIAFGTDTDTEPASLKILKDASIDRTIPHNRVIFDDSLRSWEKQGILMLNCALTVKQNSPCSHILLWNPYMTGLLKKLSLFETGLVYVLFGKFAWSMSNCINGKTNTVIKVNHPAYYARSNTAMPQELFYRINGEMKNRYNQKINFYEEV